MPLATASVSSRSVAAWQFPRMLTSLSAAMANRLLLCGPCNRAKSNTLTLSGLRKLNRQNNWMAKS